MWCDQCQQDVPGMASADGGRYCCPRCGELLGRGNINPLAGGPDAASPDASTPDASSPDAGIPVGRSAAGRDAESAHAADSVLPPYDGWELDQQLEHIERLLRISAAETTRLGAARQQTAVRVDASHAGLSTWHTARADQPAQRSKPAPARSHVALATLTWTALSLGVMALVCGGTLLGWSLVSGRTELWSVGVPVALCGQIALLIGLILQLDRLWCDSRRTEAKLDNVDRQLVELNTATKRLTTTDGSHAGEFDSHLPAGASPQSLLTDLKSQLDLLASKMGEPGR